MVLPPKARKAFKKAVGNEKSEILKKLIPHPPTNVDFDKSSVIILKVCCGSSFTLALAVDGNVYSWGQGKGLGLVTLRTSVVELNIVWLWKIKALYFLGEMAKVEDSDMEMKLVKISQKKSKY